MNRGRIFIMLTGFFAVCSTLAASPAFAENAWCSQWDVSGSWHAVQSNRTWPELKLEQTGTQFRGSAQYAYIAENSGFSGEYSVTGPIVGTVTGNSFEATVYWDNNTIGIYTGQIGPQGLIVGHAYDKTNPASVAEWHSDRAFDCRSSADYASKPAIALGRAQTPKRRALANDRLDKTDVGNAVLGASSSKLGSAQVKPDVLSDSYSKLDMQRTVPDKLTPAPAVPPPVSRPAPPARPVPGDTFAPPLLSDGARLWACFDATQGTRKGASCQGLKAGKAFCRVQGFSGGLQTRPDGTPGLTLGGVRPENAVRAINGDRCMANDCVAISELHCKP